MSLKSDIREPMMAGAPVADFTIRSSSPVWDLAKLAATRRVFPLRVVLTSDDVVGSAFHSAWQQPHDNVPALRFEAVSGNVVDVLADLEVVHGSLKPALSINAELFATREWKDFAFRGFD
jgi:hypothetical protein